MTIKELYEWCCQNNIENYQVYTMNDEGYLNYNIRLGEIQASNYDYIKVGGTIEIDTQKKEIYL